jgi:predicted metal-binding protein
MELRVSNHPRVLDLHDSKTESSKPETQWNTLVTIMKLLEDTTEIFAITMEIFPTTVKLCNSCGINLCNHHSEVIATAVETLFVTIAVKSL